MDERDLSRTLGVIESGIGRLATSQDKLTDKVTDIQVSIATLVRQEDCQEHMSSMREEISAALSVAGDAQTAATAAKYEADTARTNFEDLRRKRPPTGGVAPTPSTSTPTPTLWSRIGDNSRTIVAVVTLLGMIGGTLVAIGHYVAKVESALKIVSSRQSETTTALKKPRVIYIPMPTVFQGADAGVRPKWPKRPHR